MTPSAVALMLQTPGGAAQAFGRRSLKQFLEPGKDPDSAERLVQALIEEFEVNP